MILVKQATSQLNPKVSMSTICQLLCITLISIVFVETVNFLSANNNNQDQKSSFITLVETRSIDRNSRISHSLGLVALRPAKKNRSKIKSRFELIQPKHSKYSKQPKTKTTKISPKSHSPKDRPKRAYKHSPKSHDKYSHLKSNLILDTAKIGANSAGKNNNKNFRDDNTLTGNEEVTTESSDDANEPLHEEPITPCEPGEELNTFADKLVSQARGLRDFSLPNMTIELPEYNLEIFLYNGLAVRQGETRRNKDAWSYCGDDIVSLGLSVELRNLNAFYKFRVISGNRLLFDGNLEARTNPRAQIQLSQYLPVEDSKEIRQQRVERLKIFSLGKSVVIIRGLGNLSQSLSLMLSSYLNENPEDLQPILRNLEGELLPMADQRLQGLPIQLRK